jgi:acyl-CoA synthetase (AMP-forming)/AMP-acid ligase II
MPGTDGPKSTIGALVLSAAARFPNDDYAVTLENRLTYADLERLTGLAARHLLDLGVAKGMRVGLLVEGGRDWFVWWLGALRIGALTAPLSTLYTSRELAKVLRLADVDTLIVPTVLFGKDTGKLLENAVHGLADWEERQLRLPSVPYLRRIVMLGDSERKWSTSIDLESDPSSSAELLAQLEEQVSPADLAVIVHTSGSTADPKGVIHTHGTLFRQTAVWHQTVAFITGVPGRQRILLAMPFFWIGGILGTIGALHESLTLLVLPKLDPRAGLDLADRERATGVVGWATFTQRMRSDPSFDRLDLSSAPTLVSGPADIAMHGVPGEAPIHRSLTESGGSFVSTDLRIVDEQGIPVPIGDVGELLIRGPGTMVGYNKQERHDVFDADGWYHTNDRVYQLAGDSRLFYAGRDSELIKSAGSNVSPREVEFVLEELEEVSQCLVVGTEHSERGEEVCAIIVPARDNFDLDVVKAAARERLSRYKVPTRWIVVVDGDLPTLGTGKPDRRRVIALIADGKLG